LAKRLLGGSTTPDDENEKLLLTKLKQEYGYSFTAKLEGMLKDLKTSETLKEDWKKHQVDRIEKKKFEKLNFDLNVQVLTFGYWPSVSNSTLLTPLYVSQGCKEYDVFFKSRFEGRRLMWMFNMGNGDVRANGYASKYELNVTSYMMGVLLAFNDVEKISFGELLENTKIPVDALKGALAQLTTPTDLKEPTSRVMTHDAKKDEKTGKIAFNKDTVFTPNDKFKNKTIKIKIGAVTKKESIDESLETKKKVDDDRKMACQAAIVRIMKMRKILDHKILVNELRQQLSQFFQPELRMITEAISFLIESDYLKRDEDVSSKYIYVP